MQHAHKWMLGVMLCGLLSAPALHAEIPVVDLNDNEPKAATVSAVPEEVLPAPTAATASAPAVKAEVMNTASLPMDQRVAQLERKLQNLTQIDLLDQVKTLQQEVATLRGQLEEQTHQVSQLAEQMRVQYQDVDQRLSQPGAAKSPLKAKPVAATPLSPTSAAENDAPTTLAKTPVASVKPGDAVEEQKEYLAANKLLIKGDYVRATTALQNLLSRYPNSQYAGSAHYWLGEIYLKQGQPDPAVSEFNTVISQFPKHMKMPDAMLKLGFAYYDKGDWQMARSQLQKVKKQFPKSTVAQLASSRLEEMKEQGK